MKPDEVDLLAASMLRDFQEVQHAEKPRLARELRRDIRKTDHLDRVHDDLAAIHGIPPTQLDVGPHPDAHTARDFSGADFFAQAFGEGHKSPRNLAKRLSVS